MKEYILITDGACSGNPGPGGWAAIIKSRENILELYGGDKLTTNNIMELTAVINGLKKISSSSKITIKTDSKYVIKGNSEWLANWKKNGWITSSKKKVANKSLWIELDKLIKKHSINWEWIKGHSGDSENDRADELARKGLREFMG